MTADPGQNGQYLHAPSLAQANPVLGENAGGVFFTAGSNGRVKPDDVNVIRDAGEWTIEVVVNIPSATNQSLVGLGWINSALVYPIELQTDQVIISASGGGSTTNPITAPSTGRHHIAGTYDGITVSHYIDGVLVGTLTDPVGAGTSDAGQYWYFHGGGSNAGTALGQNVDIYMSHVALYDYCLPSAKIANHANAATNHGYAAASSGARIAALATDSLWSTAGITTGSITAEARFQAGQSALDEITETARIEQPGSLFYFDDAGNPDNRSLLDTWTSAATFGDAAGEVQYDSLSGAQMNDEVFNTSTVSAEGITGATATNTSSQSDMGVRAQDQSLIITSNSDAALIAQSIVDRFSVPSYRVDSISLNGANPMSRTQILTREVGDTIRIRRRGDGGTPIDLVTRILGKSKTFDVHGDLRCTWTLARGFNASLAQWHIGVTGFGELNQATTLA